MLLWPWPGALPRSANYGPLTVRRTGSAVTVTSVGTTANVTTADVPASAGFAHVVDAVLLPVHTSLLRVGRPSG